MGKTIIGREAIPTFPKDRYPPSLSIDLVSAPLLKNRSGVPDKKEKIRILKISRQSDAASHKA
jgi:hypothetical protein